MSSAKHTGSRVWFIIAAIAAVAALHFARSLLIPVTMSILLTFVLTPSVVFLERRVRSRVLAVGIVTVLASGLLGLIAMGVGQQFIGLAEDLPKYRETLVRRARDFRLGTASVVSEAAETIRAVGNELDRPPPGSPEHPTVPPASAVPVVPTKQGLIASTADALRPLTVPVATGSLVAILTIMMLVYRESIRDRAVRLAGLQQISLTTKALEETGERVGRYLRSQLLINLGFGATIMGGLLAIGIPRAAICGLIAGVLRFVPFIGAYLGGIVPLTLALVVFEDWAHPLLVVALFLLVELVINLAIEPWLYGASTGMSRVGVVLAIAFWAWVWGPVGLLIAMPVTVCLLVFARHVPQLEALTVVLGEEAPLSDPVRFYHRLLSGDEDQAAEVLEGAKGEPMEVMDEIVLPALRSARVDLRRDAITREDAARIAVSAQDLATDWLEERWKDQQLPDGSGTPVVLIPCSDECDQAAAEVVAPFLARAGLNPTVTSASSLRSEALEAAEQASAGVVVLSVVHPTTAVQSRRVCKAIGQRLPESRVVVANWGHEQEGKPVTVASVVEAVRDAVREEAGSTPAR